MGPKVRTACGFARATGHRAVIGSLADIADLVAGIRGHQRRAGRGRGHEVALVAPYFRPSAWKRCRTRGGTCRLTPAISL
jgi:hypothetical protein